LELPELARGDRLAGLVAIVTGAGSAGSLSGAGSAIAIVFAAQGASVVLVNRDEARAAHTLGAIQRIGQTAEICTVTSARGPTVRRSRTVRSSGLVA
jgi:NAD(P)-dependent dehydrogenase (short-subunit alcohol dehydrogenase family)